MQQVSKCYDQVCEFLEKDNRLTEFGLYGLSFGLLSYAFLRRRPISKFTTARDIPDHFIKERVLLEGSVTKIEPSAKGPVLLVNHKSPFNVSFSSKTLPIVVAGIKPDGNGVSWLQYLCDLHQNIKFVPITRDGDHCIARVFIMRENQKSLDAAVALVSLGFAKADPFTEELISKDKSLINYNYRLKANEKRAMVMRKGQWNSLPESYWKFRIRRAIEKIMFNLKPQNKKLPALCR